MGGWTSSKHQRNDPAIWFASVLDATITPIGDDDTAEGQGGSVVLKGPLPFVQLSRPGKEFFVRQEDRRIDLLHSSQGMVEPISVFRKKTWIRMISS